MKNKLLFLNVIFVTLTVFGLSCENYQSDKINNNKSSNNDFDNRKVKIISILHELSDVRYSNDNQVEEDRLKIGKENELKVKNIVNKLNDNRDLMTLALMSKTLAQNCPDVKCFKASNLRPTYENTYWKAVEKLVTKKEINKEILDELKIRSQLSGTDVGDWERIVDRKEFP